VTLRIKGQSQVAVLTLRDLRREFPQYTIWREVTPGRARYHAVRARPGIRPYAVVTASPRELRAALHQPEPSGAAVPPAAGPSGTVTLVAAPVIRNRGDE
jgi:hypothetical protein